MQKIFNDPGFEGEIKFWEIQKKEPIFEPFPEFLLPEIRKTLLKSGIEHFYKHQLAAIEGVENGQSVAITTGTASGKTLCYQIPILQELVKNPLATSLLIYPTKALTQDQFSSFQAYLQNLNTLILENQFTAAVYDGDTPPSKRKYIREKSNIILTNPDMLHMGILPHHTMWSVFLKNLRFVIVDELHTYRGVFGSHFANIIRRLKRILDFYGSKPQFILSSATISNPSEFCFRLAGEEFKIIDQDFASHPARKYYFVNPPLLDQELGIRKGMMNQSLEIAMNLILEEIQTLVFARSRRTVELALMDLQRKLGNEYKLAGYRSGYLKAERRDIEENLREGVNAAVISTNALELGIDMGYVDAVILMGYPGTKTSFFQQTGRAGRRDDESVAVLVASQKPIDQFIVQNPEFLLVGQTENALIDPDNPLLLFNHLKCAAFEMPFHAPFSFGNLSNEKIEEFLAALVEIGAIRKSNGTYFWMGCDYPSGKISIRTISNEPIQLFCDIGGTSTRIGEIDFQSALKMVHPGAVYLHNGDHFLVEELSLDENFANLAPHLQPNFTTPVSEINIDSRLPSRQRQKGKVTFSFGNLEVSEQVKSFKKIDFETREVLGIFELNLPDIRLSTKSFWISFTSELIEKLDKLNLWTNKSNEYGPKWRFIRNEVIQRDQAICQSCGKKTDKENFHVHHIKPFRTFRTLNEANQLNNLITLCSSCHSLAEKYVQMRSGLSGFMYIFRNLAPIHLMCDQGDIGAFFEPSSKWNEKLPEVYIFDQFPGGIGLCAKIYSIAEDILENCFSVLKCCRCENGCPSCVGPAGENGQGAKLTTRELISQILDRSS